MIGTVFTKPVDDWDAYAQAAEWCNQNNAYIVEYDDRYEVVGIVAPEKTFNELKADKKAEIAAARYEYEIAGVVFGGVRVTTDREDQSMITAVALSAVVDPTYTTVWKGADGYLNLDAAGVLSLARMVGAHVEAAFAAEKRLAEQIDAAQTQEDLDAVVWQNPD